MRGLLVLTILLSTPALAAGSFEKKWGLSNRQDSLSHPWEGLERKDSVIEIRRWREDKNLRKGLSPSRRLLCEIAHDLIYGAFVLRSKSAEIVLGTAFSEDPGLQSVKISFFSVRDRAVAKAADEKSDLRVVWDHEEKLGVYLSFEINRSEWKSISAILPRGRNLTREEYDQKYCDRVFQLAPHLKGSTPK